MLTDEARHIVARNLRALRAAADMSQEALARRAGISQRAVSNAERAEQSPTLDTLAALAKAFRVPTFALFLDSPDIVEQAPRIGKIVHLYQQLAADGRAQVARVAETEARYQATTAADPSAKRPAP
jgi:transcriptional regulator with XRE-family HTH domain